METLQKYVAVLLDQFEHLQWEADQCTLIGANHSADFYGDSINTRESAVALIATTLTLLPEIMEVIAHAEHIVKRPGEEEAVSALTSALASLERKWEGMRPEEEYIQMRLE